ncbi:EAL and HDOD domain-containing protein [Vibrio algicola]|uniref:EAL domain-containing protein n=1 Tax=Vibrio algicola TaxID=2662262 RepID=A0A5Q0TD88_9VIBR|nr:EAL domain-containing protein [Vibrio algicola]
MYSYIARQPIVDLDSSIVAYELLFRESLVNTFPQMDPDKATSRLLIEHFFLTNVKDIDRQIFLVNFPYQSLIEQMPTLFPSELLMIEVLEDCPPNDELFDAIQSLHSKGYRIVLDDFVPSDKWQRFLPFITLIKFDIRQFSIAEAQVFMHQNKAFKLKYLAEKIEDDSEFQACIQAGFHYFQGYHFHRPEIIRKRRIESASFMIEELKQAVQQDIIDCDYVAHLIENDITMTYKLMHFMTAHHPSTFVSVQQSLQLLGNENIKLFISLSIIAEHDSVPSPYYQSSMQRAQCCFQLAKLSPLEIDADQAYFIGMFSQLDKLFEQPLADLIQSLPLTSAAKLALTQQQGILGDILKLALALENNQADNIVNLSATLSLETHQALQVFAQANDWSTPEFRYLDIDTSVSGLKQ